MPKIDIYTKNYCPYCKKAKALLKEKNIIFNEIDVTQDIILKNEMIERSGGKTTVPQIFLDDLHIGGYDDMQWLNQQGEFDKLLNKDNYINNLDHVNNFDQQNDLFDWNFNLSFIAYSSLAIIGLGIIIFNEFEL